MVSVRAGTGYHSCKVWKSWPVSLGFQSPRSEPLPQENLPLGCLDAEELSVGRTQEGVGSRGGILSRGEVMSKSRVARGPDNEGLDPFNPSGRVKMLARISKRLSPE